MDRMVAPPSAQSLEGGDQCFNGGDGQDGGFGAGFGGEVSAGDGDISDPTREDFDLAVTDMSRQTCESRQLERPAVEGMAGIGDGDLALAFLRDQRGITLDEFSPPPADPGSTALASPEARRRSPAPPASSVAPPAGTRSRSSPASDHSAIPTAGATSAPAAPRGAPARREGVAPARPASPGPP